jgi:Domain of unknown function (DUF4167)
MRQGQQNRRGRGRQGGGGHTSNQHNQSNANNNNRKGQNPLARSYESNGPDVKIRGNPAHIAEKYTTLARDAQSSGDSVLAEAYLQYAEHYNRIIMAYREQQQQSGEGQYRPRVAGEAGDPTDQAGEEYGDDQSANEASIRGQEPQPGMFDSPQTSRFADRSLDQPGRDDRGSRDERPHRGYDDRQNRRDGNRDGGQQREGQQRDGGQHRDGGQQRDGGQRDGVRRERYGENQQRGYNGNRDDRRERFDRNAGPERQAGDRPNNDRGYQDRQPRPPHERPNERHQERDAQDRPERFAPDRPAFDRGAQDRVPSDVVEAASSSDIQASVTPVSSHDIPAAHEAMPANVAAAVPVPRDPPARRRAAAIPAADRFTDAQQEQPEFLRRPVRRPKRETAVPAADAGEADEPGKNET